MTEEVAVSANTTRPSHDSYLMPRLEHATVSDAMRPGIFSCEPDATLRDVARLMASEHVHGVVVMGVSHDPGIERLA
jgi:CBS domain-containing protein